MLTYCLLLRHCHSSYICHTHAKRQVHFRSCAAPEECLRMISPRRKKEKDLHTLPLMHNRNNDLVKRNTKSMQRQCNSLRIPNKRPKCSVRIAFTMKRNAMFYHVVRRRRCGRPMGIDRRRRSRQEEVESGRKVNICCTTYTYAFSMRMLMVALHWCLLFGEQRTS